MTRALFVWGASLLLGLAVLALLLAALSIALGRPDAVALYGAVSLIAFALVTWLMRRERRARLAREALLPPAERPARRSPRQPIRLPLRATVLTFLVWYAIALGLAGLRGGPTWFDVAAIAPFASFLLTVLTFAGRHIAFRLTAEE